jgi:GT2 family glycosyltransferase
LVRDQDDEYNYRIRKLGGRLVLAADVSSRYHSRATLRSLWWQYFGYGFWKTRVLLKHPRQMKARQFVPGVLVACLALGVIFSPFSHRARSLLGATILSYSAASASASWRLAAQSDSQHLMKLPAAFAAMHMGYGVGFLLGLARIGAGKTEC